MIFFAIFILSGWAVPQSVFEAKSPSLPSGTRIEAKLQTAVRTESSKIGDEVTALVSRSLRTREGIVLPEGSRLTGRVETLQAGSRSNEGRVRLVFREIQLPDGRIVPTWITNSFAAPPERRGLRYFILMGTGAAAGAFIGGSNSRIAGVLGGLLTGFVIAGSGRQAKLPDLTLEEGQKVALELLEALTIPSR